jgi:hypothetical protein
MLLAQSLYVIAKRPAMLQKSVTLLFLSVSLSALAQSSGQGLKPAPVAPVAKAAPDAYVEVSLNSLNYAQTGLRLSPTALRTIVGKNMGPTFSYEGMLAFGTSQGTDTLGGKSAAAKIDPLFGAYLRARQELAPGLEVFGRVGAASLVKNLDGAYFASEASSKRMGALSYGLGVKIRINRKASFVTDYTSYYNRREETIDGVSLGLAIDY